MTNQDFKDNVFILKDKMYRFAKRLLDCPDEPKDVVQEVLIKLWQMKNELWSLKNVEAFSMRCIKNECLNRLKHAEIVEVHRLQRRGEELFIPKYADNTSDIILKIINNLPDKQKMVIHLKDVEDYDTKEIGEMLDLEENAVRVNLFRARQNVRTELEKIFEYEKQKIRGTKV